MALRGDFLPWIVLAVAVAGCSQPRAGPAGVAVDEETWQMPDAGAPLHGWVLDDEHRPVDNASVLLVGTPLKETTLTNGSYAFGRAPAGWLNIAVLHPAYVSATFSVHTDDGVPLRRNFTIQKVDTNATFTEVFPHKTLHHLTTCDACSWNFTTQGNPSYLVVEVTGRHEMASPSQRTSETITVRNDTAGGKRLYDATAALPARLILKNPDRAFHFRVTLACERGWICNEDGRDVWITAFHHMEVPNGYTALRP